MLNLPNIFSFKRSPLLRQFDMLQLLLLYVVLFHVLHFHVLSFGPSISRPAFSAPPSDPVPALDFTLARRRRPNPVQAVHAFKCKFTRK